MKKFINLILDKIIFNLNKIKNNFNKVKGLQLVSLSYDNSGRYLVYTYANNKLKNSKDVLHGIYTSLMNNDRFINFGFNKIIIVSVIIHSQEYSFHHNVLINNNTTFEDYYNQVAEYIDIHYDSDYVDGSAFGVDIIPGFKVKVWNMDNYLNKKIKITKTSNNVKYNINKLQRRSYSTLSKNAIKPIKNNIVTGIIQPISTMDIETIEYKGNQIPIAVSLAYQDSYNQVMGKLFLINYELLLINKDKALDNLWNEVFNFIIINQFKYIFVHNLGSFDGFFIYKALSYLFPPKKVSTIIDNKNKFIQIQLKLDTNKITWLDSYRIFPVSLDNLCKVFGVAGKISKYNSEYNSIKTLSDKVLLEEFKTYSIQDSICLLQALLSAQQIYVRDFNIDITSILSTSTLSLKIFRSKFLNVDIPILKGSIDNFIRRSYYGGGTDYYKAYETNLHYYDVNSLYPHAMCQFMPFEIIREHKNLDLFLNENTDLFGFFEAECYIPKSNKPMLPFKYKDKTIYPYGSWVGVYFSEEMKSLLKYGYKFKLIRGYEFSKIDLFTEYVKYFYNIKRTTSGPSKFIAKMHLNQLYGIFGRKQDLIETINIYSKDINKYLLTRIVKTHIKINEEKTCLLLQNNVDPSILINLNNYFESNFNSRLITVKSNVALAAAVTSYARIHMLPFKFDNHTLYTDTDSIFTSKKLDDYLINTSELGLMKDELNGKIIEEAYFLGIKQYGYYYFDNQIKIEKSTFAGVPKNNITFEEIKLIHENKLIFKTIPIRFFKSFKDFSINIKNNIKMELSRSNDKKLVNNTYLPMNIIKYWFSGYN
jgi:hypothetical protein